MRTVYGYLLVFIGAGLGGALRHAANLASTRFIGPDLPLSTLFVNVLGSFALGFFFALRERSLRLSPDLWLFLGTGLCGGFTTMSTFSLETLALVRQRELYYAGLNLVATLAGCLAATGAGYVSARALTAWAR